MGTVLIMYFQIAWKGVLNVTIRLESGEFRATDKVFAIARVMDGN